MEKAHGKTIDHHSLANTTDVSQGVSTTLAKLTKELSSADNRGYKDGQMGLEYTATLLNESREPCTEHMHPI